MKQIGTLLGRPVVEDDSVASATIVFAPPSRKITINRPDGSLLISFTTSQDRYDGFKDGQVFEYDGGRYRFKCRLRKLSEGVFAAENLAEKYCSRERMVGEP